MRLGHLTYTSGPLAVKILHDVNVEGIGLAPAECSTHRLRDIAVVGGPLFVHGSSYSLFIERKAVRSISFVQIGKVLVDSFILEALVLGPCSPRAVMCVSKNVEFSTFIKVEDDSSRLISKEGK